MKFDKDLKAWRKLWGLTQAQAAVYLCVPVRSLEEWEQDRSTPNQIGPIRKLMSQYDRKWAKGESK